MKVKDLIEALDGLAIDPDAEVHVWVNGVRYAIDPACPVDPWDSDGEFVDINVKEA